MVSQLNKRMELGSWKEYPEKLSNMGMVLIFRNIVEKERVRTALVDTPFTERKWVHNATLPDLVC
jgi:hypothetical protein